MLVEKTEVVYYLTHRWENKDVHAFPSGISLKENVIEQLKFELVF